MSRRLIFLFVAALFIAAGFRFDIAGIVQAQYNTVDQIFNQVYGSQNEGCTQVDVTTTGHNRSGPFTAGRRYVIYGYDGSDFSTGDALRCVQGGSSIDVTSIGSSKVGKVIYANQQEIWQFKTGSLYLSCISKTASMKYDVCPYK